VLNALTLVQPADDGRLFFVQLRRDDGENGVADHFCRRIAEDAFGRRVPTGDDAVQVLADNGIFRGIDQRLQQGTGASVP
jgi:hypothetical protein